MPERKIQYLITFKAELALPESEGYIESGIPKTARTMVGVAELPLGALVEITARAYLLKNA
ncbi:RidA family protein [Candidatus Woesearchaeota archaeon]|nr:RidA family protein [Candidatus Woesearchaeota archaeon]